jgi:formate hydrogenlyase transcriptional activator
LNIKNNEAGCRGLLMAGDAFVKSYQLDKALECYTKLKKDLLNLKGKAIDDLFIDMAIKSSKISTAKQTTTEVIETLKNASERAERKNDRASQALIQMHIAKNEWLLNHHSRSLKMFNKGWSLANNCNDKNLMRSAISFRTFFSFWQGRFKEVINHYENAILDVEAYPQDDIPALVIITIGQCYTHIGQITQGLGMLDTIQKSSQKLGDMYTTAFATGSINKTLLMIHSADETLEYVRQNYTEIQQSGNQYIALLTEIYLAYLYYLKGDITHSVDYLKKYIQNGSVVNIDTLYQTPYILELCWAMEKGLYPRLMDLSLTKETNKLINGQNIFLKGLAYRYKAFLEIQTGQSKKVIMNSLVLSMKWLEESGYELEILQTRMELLRQYLIMGDLDSVKEMSHRVQYAISKYHYDMIPSDLKTIFRDTSSPQHAFKEILRLGREIMTIFDSKDLIQRIISDVNQLTGAERGAIFLLDKDSEVPTFKLRASKNLTYEDVAHPIFESSINLMEQVIKEGVNLETAIKHDPEPLFKSTTLKSDVIRSRVCVPMIFKNKTIGVLYHDNRLLSSIFKESDYDLLSFYATLAAIILDNDDAQEKIRHLNQTIHEGKQYDEETNCSLGKFKGIIGKSNAIKQILFLVEQVAKTETNVLILGETGVGKDLVANAIHDLSERRNKPFIKANCSALTETLINSELFGHERGAFTGANNRRIGRFELANGGTIFMDEIGDLPLSSQANLLRVLQSHEFERVGGNETVHSHFRLIAATNRDLEQLVKEKIFRADLYFRLNVFPIHIPSLRERKEDIPLLVHHFILQLSQKIKKEVKKVPSIEMKKLMQYDWPGNVRELENVIERDLVLNSSPVFKAPNVEQQFSKQEMQQHVYSLKDNERNHILWALNEKGWKVRGPEGVAKLLEIHPSTLAARMKKLNINRS